MALCCHKLLAQLGSDKTAVPLCPHHHLTEYHGKLGSKKRAEEVWNINFDQIITTLRERYESGDVGPHQHKLPPPQGVNFSLEERRLENK